MPRTAARSNVSRSVQLAPASASEIAVGTGNSASRKVTLSPTPTTTASSTTSARIPASFRSPIIRSFGHFNPTSTSATRRNADATPTPTTSGSKLHRAGGTATDGSGGSPTCRSGITSGVTSEGRNSIENVRPDRAGADHERSSRPRAAVWCSATSTRPAAAPARAKLDDVRVGRTGLFDDPDLAPDAVVDEPARQRPNRQRRPFEVGPGRRATQPVFCRPAATPLTASSSRRCVRSRSSSSSMPARKASRARS